MGFEIINRLKKEQNLTNAQLAAKAGVTLSTLDKITAGINTNPKLDTLQALCEALGCRLDDFDDSPRSLAANSAVTPEELNHIKKYRSLDGHGKKMVDLILDGEAERMAAEKEKPMPEVKIYDLIEYLTPVSAGRGVLLDGSGEYFHYNVVANRYTEKADYTVRVQGRSMEPRFFDGDRLLVEETPDIDFGEVGIFVVNGQGYVKLKGETSLLSINPFYPGVTIDEYTDFRCVGRVVGTLDSSWVVE